jgi:uncharacterized phage protein (TIGR02218 family)
MKTISAGLTTHIASGTTTLATCWRIERADGTTYGFTDHDQDIVYSGVTYEASTGHTPTNVTTAGNLAVDNLDHQVLLDSTRITEADLIAGVYDYARVYVFLINWADTTQDTIKLRYGTLGQINTDDLTAKAESRGLAQQLQQTIGRTIGPDCDANFGDSRCDPGGTLLTAETYTGSVTNTPTTQNSFADSTKSTKADGYFQYGKLTWTGGNNINRVAEVLSFTSSGGLFTLKFPMPAAIANGDTFSLVAGCDRTANTCKTKWSTSPVSNFDNFQGFPHLIGNDQLQDYEAG